MARYTDDLDTSDAWWEFSARTADDRPHAEQEELLEGPHQGDGYFDVIMRVRRRRWA